MSDDHDADVFSIAPAIETEESAEPTPPWRALLWLLFGLLLVCSPAIVLAVYGAVL